MTIFELQVENVKGVKAVRIKPNGSPLVVLKGRNEAGKSSVIDAIWYAIGGAGGIPEDPVRHGQKTARAIVTFDGLEVERRWTKGGQKTYLEVRGADGKARSSPQSVLDDLYSAIAFDPLSFARLAPKAQAETLRELAGLDFSKLDSERDEAFSERTVVNRRIKELKGQLSGMPPVEAPAEEVSAAVLTQQLAELQTRSSSLNEKRVFRDRMKTALERAEADVVRAEQQLARAREEAQRAAENLSQIEAEIQEGEEAGAPTEEEVADLKNQIAHIEETNRRVRAKKARAEVADLLSEKQEEAETLSKRLADIDEEKKKLLRDADLPIEGLAIEEDCIAYKGVPFSQCSSAVRWKVSTALGFRLNGDINIAAIRDGSVLDEDSLLEVAKIAAEHNGQVIVECVGKTGGAPGVIIEDGEVEAIEDGAFAQPDSPEASIEVEL